MAPRIISHPWRSRYRTEETSGLFWWADFCDCQLVAVRERDNNPEPRKDSSGVSASSEYRNVHSAIALSAKAMVAGNVVLGVKNGCSEESTIPMSRVKLVTNPETFAFTDPSAETNHASTRMRSVTNRCSSKLASSGEIMLAFMAEDIGYKEAAFWCNRLGIYP
jgi:hypothetical protein